MGSICHNLTSVNAVSSATVYTVVVWDHCCHPLVESLWVSLGTLHSMLVGAPWLHVTSESQQPLMGVLISRKSTWPDASFQPTFCEQGEALNGNHRGSKCGTTGREDGYLIYPIQLTFLLSLRYSDCPVSSFNGRFHCLFELANGR